MMNQKSGHIINISSYAGIKGKKGLSAYSVSKAGLIGLTKSCAKELAGYNVMVNAVLPGYMITDMGMESSARGKDTALKESMLKEFTDPDNVAGFIAYLSETKGVTGQIFNLDSRVM
jgi:3-oxoacyl-[acyl-carrier protein] reductase